MQPPSLSPWPSRSPVADPAIVDADAFARHPLPRDAIRALSYMADVESHTIVYLRELLSTRAIDDPEMAAFFACWFYEETAHGRALAGALAASGHPPALRTRQARSWRARVEATAIAALSAAWPQFLAVHMTWGAINEITALTAYRRLAALVEHPALRALLGHIARDESRHFAFYYAHAERRLAASALTRRVVRGLVERFWAPVGHDVQPDAELRALGAYLFSGPDGRAAAQIVDRTIQRLPGFTDVPLIGAWLDRAVG
ncbi:MAG: ferritin-like domain-containing protein [Deltaproteobacteria bacterium]|nr:ferritin-like domain-containing protein [Deltaproteobacteria bacterium]